MVSMKKNHELFWILEVLLLTPVALFWSSVVSMMLSNSNSLYIAVVGDPASPARVLLVTLLCPGVAALLAYKYLTENKKEKGTTQGIAKLIMLVGIVSIVLVLVYLYGQQAPRN